jgi:thymidylate synthase
MPIYIAAKHDGFDIDNLSDILREIEREPRKREFIRALMTNKNIKDTNVRVWLMLQ